jgi:hypothetical protein
MFNKTLTEAEAHEAMIRDREVWGKQLENLPLLLRRMSDGAKEANRKRRDRGRLDPVKDADVLAMLAEEDRLVGAA